MEQFKLPHFSDLLNESRERVSLLLDESKEMFVKCRPEDKTFYLWKGVCSKCQTDHPRKYWTINKIAIPNQFQIVAILPTETTITFQQFFEIEFKNLTSLPEQQLTQVNSQISQLCNYIKSREGALIEKLDAHLVSKPITQQSMIIDANHFKFLLSRFFHEAIYEEALKISIAQFKINESRSTELRSKMGQTEGNIQQLKEEIVNLKDIIQQIPMEIEQFAFKKSALQKQIIDERNVNAPLTDQLMLNDDSHDKQAKQFYDVTIDCDSILELTDGNGWEVVYYNNKYQQIREMKGVQVFSFYGLYNRGKSFLASNLSGKRLPKGFSVSTTGLSVLYPDRNNSENQFVFLDTAGTETPINVKKQIGKAGGINVNQEDAEDLYEQKLKDRLLTEHLLQKFILEQSDVLIVVVDQLTKEEQRMIQKIKNVFDLKTKKLLVIVHNFSKLLKVSEVKDFIKKDVLQSFEVEELSRKLEFSEGSIYKEKQYNAVHLIIANQFGESGQQYNKFCYEFIKTSLMSTTHQQKFDVVESLRSIVEKHLPSIIEMDQDSEKKISVSVKQEQLQAGENVKLVSRIVINEKSQKLKNISFDLLGDLRVFKSGLNPKYYHFTEEIENQQYFIVQVELSGKVQAFPENQKQGEYRVLTCKITGNSIQEKHGFQNSQNDQTILIQGYKVDVIVREGCQSNRESGFFKVLLVVNPQEYLLNEEPPEFLCECGILQVRYLVDQNEIPIF